jgi:hypothetical protein
MTVSIRENLVTRDDCHIPVVGGGEHVVSRTGIVRRQCRRRRFTVGFGGVRMQRAAQPRARRLKGIHDRGVCQLPGRRWHPGRDQAVTILHTPGLRQPGLPPSGSSIATTLSMSAKSSLLVSRKPSRRYQRYCSGICPGNVSM